MSGAAAPLAGLLVSGLAWAWFQERLASVPYGGELFSATPVLHLVSAAVSWAAAAGAAAAVRAPPIPPTHTRQLTALALIHAAVGPLAFASLHFLSYPTVSVLTASLKSVILLLLGALCLRRRYSGGEVGGAMLAAAGLGGYAVAAVAASRAAKEHSNVATDSAAGDSNSSSSGSSSGSGSGSGVVDVVDAVVGTACVAAALALEAWTALQQEELLHAHHAKAEGAPSDNTAAAAFHLAAAPRLTATGTAPPQHQQQQQQQQHQGKRSDAFRIMAVMSRVSVALYAVYLLVDAAACTVGFAPWHSSSHSDSDSGSDSGSDSAYLATAAAFAACHPAVLLHAAGLGATAAAQHLCIVLCIRDAGSLVTASASLSRKALSTLLSALLFKHAMAASQWVSVAAVFAGLGWQLVAKRQAGQQVDAH